MYVYDGEAASLTFPFQVDGEFITPTSATYTVRGHSGVGVAGLVNQPITITPGMTEAVVGVAGDKNALVSGDKVQNRYVEVKFVYHGQTYQRRQVYSIAAFLGYAVTEADVRSAMGLFDFELKDSEVDLVRAYWAVAATAGASFVTAITATDATNVAANDAIKYRAALDLMPSLQLRVTQSTSDDNVKVTRLTKVDLDVLASSLAHAYSKAILALDPSATVTTQDLLVVSAPVDPVTNV